MSARDDFLHLTASAGGAASAEAPGDGLPPPAANDAAPADALADDGLPPLPEHVIPEDVAGQNTDALLHALVWLTRHHGQPRSAASLMDGQPLKGVLAPDDALRVMRHAGYNAGLVQRPLPEIHTLLLPAVLLLKGGDACILLAREAAGPGQPVRCSVVMPGPENHVCVATEDELAEAYLGVALVATPLPQKGGAGSTATLEKGLLDRDGHWLWGTMRRFLPYYRSALLAALLSNVLMLVTGLVTSVVYDKVIPHQAFVTLWSLAIGAGIALAFDLTARQLRAHLIDMAGKKADTLIGSLLFRQTLGVRMEHRPESAGSYAHHLAQVEVVREFFASATLSAVTDLPFIALFVAMTFVIGGPLGWVLVIAIPLIVGVTVAMQSSLRRAMSANMQHLADVHGIIVEAVEGLEDLKATGAHGRFLRRYEDATVAAAETQLVARRLSAWTMNLSMVSQQVITLVMLVWGVYLIHAGQVTGGALIGAVMYAGRAVAPLGSVVGLATRYQGARAAMVSLDRMMSLPTERDAQRQYVPHPEITGRVALHDLHFSYPATGPEAAPAVLKGVNLRVRPGERVGVLGRIGSGKSTILRLMAGLYQPTEGMVEVDGIDLRQIDPADWRAQVGFVSQEPRLFKGTLRDNVQMGRAEIDAVRLAEVARVTGLDRLVASHPMGWELSVGEMGGLLSGGQRQLVALARCLASQPRVLLMDEPTSSMDAQSEVQFLRQLRGAVGDRTLVMVTHRPAVLELVDRLVVVDNGRVVLDGPKAQVLAALSGVRPAATATTAPAPANVHLHPHAHPVVTQGDVV